MVGFSGRKPLGGDLVSQLPRSIRTTPSQGSAQHDSCERWATIATRSVVGLVVDRPSRPARS